MGSLLDSRPAPKDGWTIHLVDGSGFKFDKVSWQDPVLLAFKKGDNFLTYFPISAILSVFPNSQEVSE